jgi:membrane protein implicated in regulation of membrane protease activity
MMLAAATLAVSWLYLWLSPRVDGVLQGVLFVSVAVALFIGAQVVCRRVRRRYAAEAERAAD